MLILSRNIGQIIMINDDIKIKVMDIRGRQVKLMFEASKNIPIHREEIYNKIMQQKNVMKSF